MRCHRTTKQRIETSNNGVLMMSSADPQVKALKLDQIRVDGGTQIRAEINEDAVAEYAEARKSGDHLQESKSREQEARAYLESCRRNVKDKQRQTADMEAEMSEARELLAQREQSCDEIEQTVKQICGDKIPPESNDTMLF